MYSKATSSAPYNRIRRDKDSISLQARFITKFFNFIRPNVCIYWKFELLWKNESIFFFLCCYMWIHSECSFYLVHYNLRLYDKKLISSFGQFYFVELQTFPLFHCEIIVCKDTSERTASRFVNVYITKDNLKRKFT